MLYTILLAGGSGKRMGNTTVPKQFIEISGIPIIIRTLKKLRRQPKIEKIVQFCIFFGRNICIYQKKAVPLHPISESNAWNM